MKLPKIDLPIYDTYLPSTGQKVTYRPYTVKEMKILMTAGTNKDNTSAIALAIKQIVNNCVEGIDVDDLKLVDFEFLFIKIRSVSQSNVLDLVLNTEAECLGELSKNEMTGQMETPCKGKINFQVDLDTIEILNQDGSEFVYGSMKESTFNVVLNEDITITIASPGVDDVIYMNDRMNTDPDQGLFDFIRKLTKVVYYKEEAMRYDQVEEDDLKEFIESMSVEHLEKIEQATMNFPRVVLNKKIKCSRCGIEKKVHLEEVTDFFG